MGKGLKLGAAALVLLLGAACGGRPQVQPRYLYYPGPDQATATSVEPATDGTLPGEAADDPTPADYVNAAPAAVNAAPATPGAIGRVEIPKVGVSQPMFEGVGLDVLANGPGHWSGTAMPGDNGNAVVAGHRVTHTHPFLDIDQLNAGDEVIFTTAAGRFVYAVTQTFVVTPDATWIANPTTDPTITLFACHPKHEKTHRIVVTGHLIAAQRTAPPAPPPKPAPAAPSPAPAPPPPAEAPAAATPPPAPPSTAPPESQPKCDSWLCLGGH